VIHDLCIKEEMVSSGYSLIYLSRPLIYLIPYDSLESNPLIYLSNPLIYLSNPLIYLSNPNKKLLGDFYADLSYIREAPFERPSYGPHIPWIHP